MTPKEFKRLYRIVSILLEQGIDELVPARYQPCLAVWPVAACSGSRTSNKA